MLLSFVELTKGPKDGGNAGVSQTGVKIVLTRGGKLKLHANSLCTSA